MKTTLLLVIFFTAGSTLIGASQNLVDAAMRGNLKKIASLIESGVDINGKGDDGVNPAIFWAIDLEEFDAVRLLLNNCPNQNVRGNYDWKISDGCFAVSDLYSCSLLDAAYQHKESGHLVEKYYSEGCSKCLAGNYTLLNTNWLLPITDKDRVVNVACPAGDVSHFSIWRCGNNSEWDGAPDLSQCQHHQFRQPNETDSYLAADAIAAVAADIEDVDLYPGDVVYILQRLKTLLKNYESDVRQANYSEGLLLSEKFLEGLVKTMAKVMEEPLNWQYMSEEMRKSSATDIQESIVKACLASGRFFNASTSPAFSGDNIYVRVVRQPRRYFDLDENRRFQDPNLTQTWIELPELFYNNYTSSNGSKESAKETDDEIVVVFNVFSNLHCLINDIPCSNPPDEKNIFIPAKQQVNSDVIGVKIGYGDTWNAEPNRHVVVNFSHIYDGFTVNISNPKCVWWNTKSNNWSSEGCELQKYTEYYSICHCDHLTNLAIIMDFNGLLRNVTREFTLALEGLTIVGCSLSIGCLAVCIVLFCLLMCAANKKKKEIGARKYLIRLNMSVCLLLAQLILLVGLNKTKPKILCTVVAASLHFFFLAAFTWSAIEAFTLYLAFVKVFDTSTQIKQKHYLMAGYGMPFFFVAATLAIFQAEGYGTDHVCWLAPGGILWSFAGSISCILLANMVAFVMAIRHVWKARSREVSLRSTSNASPNTRKIIGPISIFLVLGLTWITGFFYMFKGTEPLAVLFTVLNSLQGVCILFFGVIFQESIRTELFSIINEKVKSDRVPPVVRQSIIKTLRKSGFIEARNNLDPETLSINVTYRSGDNNGEASAKGAAVNILCTDIESSTSNYHGALQKNFNDVTDSTYDDYGEASEGGVASDSFSTDVRHRTLADTGDINLEAAENMLNDYDYDEDSDISK